ncbi:MAG: hypothetical protein LBI04_10075 [Treponema sp.]|jgi:hypothetical protein|nr:hypothetical protein [Treponema sp.]
MSEDNRRLPDNAELYKLVKDMLSHDKVMARCVLGRNQNVLKDDEEFENCREQSFLLIKWMGNLVTLAGAFLYSKFNMWRSETGAHPTDKARPNALYLKRLLAGVQSTDAYFDQASSGLRVLRVLDGLYDSFDMNFLVIKYIIINSQIEAGFNFQDEDDDKRGLSQLIGFPHEESIRVTCNPAKKFKQKGCNLAAAFNFISIFRNDPRLKQTNDTDKYKTSDIECAFEDIFRTMEFMKRVRLDIDGEGNVIFIETEANGEEKKIPSHGVARIFETKKGECTDIYRSGTNLPRDWTIDFYLLERIEYFPAPDANNAALTFSYQAFDESDSALVYFSEKDGLIPEDCDFEITREKSAVDCYKRISGYLPGTRSASSFFRGMITTHYRYHNVLSPSVVDAIDDDRDAKTRILREFVKNDETPFKEALEPTFKTLEHALGKTFPIDWKDKIENLCEYILSDEYRFRRVIDWDTLMARILIYEGPSEIVRTALLHNEAYTYTTDDKKKIEKVCDQIIAGLEMRYIDNIFDALTVSQKQKENYSVLRPSINNLKEYFPGSYTIKMECKALAQSYINTIVNTLTKIDNKDNKAENNKFAENSIQDTLEILKAYKSEKNQINVDNAFLRTIKAFLLFYAGIFKSCRSRMSYEFEKSSIILSPKEIEKWQYKIEDEFFLGVAEKAAELTKKFKAETEADAMLAVQVALKELLSFADMSSEDERYYFAVLARTPINAQKLKKIFCVDDKGNLIFEDNRKEVIDFEQAVEYKLLTGYLENIVRFLGGDDINEDKSKEQEPDKSNYTGYKEFVKKVVYPQIVTFAKHREDCDANDCLIMDHTGAFAGWHDGEVQILTEFKFTINHSYYAMPNLNRIETEWWVDPILISCYRFDEEVRKASVGASN